MVKKKLNKNRKTIQKEKTGLLFKQLKLKLRIIKAKSRKIDNSKVLQKKK